MKTLKNVLKILAIVLGFGAIALFFFDFAKVALPQLNTAVGLKGIDLAFGGEISFAANGTTYNPVLAKSAYYLTTFILCVFTAALGVFGIKKNGSSVASMIFSVITGIMLCSYNAGGSKYVDTQGLEKVSTVGQTDIVYFAWIAAGLLFAAAVVTALAILAGDKAKVNEQGGKTIPQRVIRFIKDYIGEIKKITWPKVSAATKNTVIVVIISLLIGAFVWLLDWGLSALIDWGIGL